MAWPLSRYLVARLLTLFESGSLDNWSPSPAWNNMDVKVGQDLIGSIVILKECCARSAKGFTQGDTHTTCNGVEFLQKGWINFAQTGNVLRG